MIVELIKDTIAQLSIPTSAIVGDRAEFNQLMDHNKIFPVALLLNTSLVASFVLDQQGVFNTQYDIQILFLDMRPDKNIDDSGEKMQPTTDTMELLAKEFLGRLITDSRLFKRDAIKSTPTFIHFFRLFDTQLDGGLFSMKIELLREFFFCAPTVELTSFVIDDSTPNEVKVDWASTAEKENVGSYRIIRKLEGDLAGIVVGTIPTTGVGNSYTFTDTSVEDGVYEYFIQAVSPNGTTIFLAGTATVID